MSRIIFMYFHNYNPIMLISKEDGEQKKNKLSTGFCRLHLIYKTPTFVIFDRHLYYQSPDLQDR